MLGEYFLLIASSIIQLSPGVVQVRCSLLQCYNGNATVEDKTEE